MSNLDDALQAIAQQKAAEDQVRTHTGIRDQAIVRMHTDDGWNPPRIARETGLSVSTIRLVLRLAGALGR